MNEIVSDLYGLRGGLSLIAQKVDEIQKCEDKKEKIIDNRECKTYQLGEKRDFWAAKLSEKKENSRLMQEAYRKASSRYEKAYIANSNRKSMSYEAKKAKAKAKYLEKHKVYTFDFSDMFDWDEGIPYLPTAIWLLICLSIGMSLWGVFFWVNDDPWWDRLLVSILGAAVYAWPAALVVKFLYNFFAHPIRFICSVFVRAIIPSKKINRLIAEENAELEKEERTSKAELDEMKRNLENALKSQTEQELNTNALLVSAKNDYNAYFNDTAKTIKECDIKKQELKKEARNIKQGLIKAYSSLIAESDWENIDLLIYYMQTGRADNLKEALQQVDRQRQTEEIVGAIKVASSYIVQEIRNTANTMGQALAKSFSVISGQLSDIKGEISRNNERLLLLTEVVATSTSIRTRENKEISIQNARQIAATEINNALLKKSNESSRELVETLHKIERDL